MQLDLHRSFNCSLQVLLILLHCLWPRATRWLQGRHTHNHLLNFMETLRVHVQMGGLVLNVHFGYVLFVVTSLAAMAAKGKLHGPLQENLFPHLVIWSLGIRSMWSSRIQGPAPSSRANSLVTCITTPRRLVLCLISLVLTPKVVLNVMLV